MKNAVVLQRKDLQKVVRDLNATKKKIDDLLGMFTEMLGDPPYDDGSNGGEFFAVVRWGEEDIKQALTKDGYKITRANVKRVLDSRTSRTLQERSIEEGWEVMSVCLDFVDGLEKRKGA
jgi:hypothetical protein